MALVQLNDIAVSFGGRKVLDRESFSLYERERCGLVGANGSGKTTLLRVIAGMLEADSGLVARKRHLRIGFLEQEPDLPADANVHEAALSAFADLLRMEKHMRRIEHEIAVADGTRRADLLRQLGTLQSRFEHAGGYQRESRTAAVLMGMGLKKPDFTKPVSVLSGGERSRLALARLLLREADLLLLDEPTNHLDLDGIEWLEDFLSRKFRGAALVVSHDRVFLDRAVTRILDVARGRVSGYPGNYSKYAALKAHGQLAQQREHDKQRRFIEHEEEFIRRYHAGQRSKEARGRRRRLERLERVEPVRHDKHIALRFQPRRESSELCFRVEDLSKSYERYKLIEGLSFEVYRGERVGIVGPNGSGKTTLLKMLLGRESPDSGAVEVGHNVAFGYVEQHPADTASEETVLDEVWNRNRRLDEVEVRSVLGRFLLGGDDDVAKKLRDLSGGERTRVSLACLMIERPNVLVLDEPTNHLDIPSRIALESALEAYEGTLIIASHDRYFLNKTVRRIILIDGERSRVICGNFEYYEALRQRERAGGAGRVNGSGREAVQKPTPKRPAKPRRRTSKNQLARMEEQLSQLEKEKESLEAELAKPEVYADPQRARELPKRYQRICRDLETLYGEWLGHESA